VGYNGGVDDQLSLQLGDAPDGINTEALALKDTAIDGETEISLQATSASSMTRSRKSPTRAPRWVQCSLA
jgi:hypothetical protein